MKKKMIIVMSRRFYCINYLGLDISCSRGDGKLFIVSNLNRSFDCRDGDV